MSRRHRFGLSGLFGLLLVPSGCGPTSSSPLPPPKIGKPPEPAGPVPQLGPIRFGLESKETIREPVMRVEAPVGGAKFTPDGPIDGVVMLQVRDKADLPSKVYAQVRDAVGSYDTATLKVAGEPDGGSYRLVGRLKAPGKKGRYQLHAEAEYVIIDRASGKAEALRFRSPALNIEVQ